MPFIFKIIRQFFFAFFLVLPKIPRKGSISAGKLSFSSLYSISFFELNSIIFPELLTIFLGESNLSYVEHFLCPKNFCIKYNAIFAANQYCLI